MIVVLVPAQVTRVYAVGEELEEAEVAWQSGKRSKLHNMWRKLIPAARHYQTGFTSSNFNTLMLYQSIPLSDLTETLFVRTTIQSNPMHCPSPESKRETREGYS